MLIGAIIVLSVVLSAVFCLCCGGFQDLSWLWMLPAGFVGSFLIWAVLAFLLIWISSLVVRLDREQQEDSPYYRWLVDLYIEAAFVILQMRIHTQGLEKVPKDGRFLLVCNHLNDTDPLILLGCFRKSQLAFISKRENDQKFIVGKLMHKILCQPINRENDREALKTILKCIQIIKEDKASIAVFPEGYTSMDHKLHRFRSGVFKIAQKTKVPVVVCTLTNSYHVFGNALRLKPTDIDLHLLDVIRPEEYEGMTTVALADKIHAMMAQDLGPEYAPEENT